MRTNINNLRVFAASPGDTKQERLVIADVVNHINRLVGHQEHFRLQQVLWEEDSYPDVGADAQDVINRQLGDYDMFVGLMGYRFGSPTKRAESGTEEEFNRAFQRYMEDPRGIRIMFYFRNSAVNAFDIDPYQLLQVHNFRQRLQRLGVHYDVYQTIEEFREKLEYGLTQNVRDFIAKQRDRKPRKRIAKSSNSKTIVTLPDWDAQTNSKNQSVFPQWARYREIPLIKYPSGVYGIKGTFQSNSSYFRFGFKFLPVSERPFGDASIQSEGSNIVVHIGKNTRSSELFLTSYFNGIRRASDKRICSYKGNPQLAVECSVSEQNVASLSIDGHLVFQSHVSPDITRRLLLLAWGDEHEFAVSFRNITLEYF